MYKRHPRNNFSFDKNGMKRPGYNTGFVNIKEKRDNPAEQDRKNRINVIKEIEKHIAEGKTLDEALNILCPKKESKDGCNAKEYEETEHTKNFEYLIKNGLDLRDIFKSWYESSQKNKNRKVNPFFGER